MSQNLNYKYVKLIWWMCLCYVRSTFPSPTGTDPVFLDLDGMEKGEVWVNGRSIGRYWATVISTKDGCSPTCEL